MDLPTALALVSLRREPAPGIQATHVGFDKLKKKLSHQKGVRNPGAVAYEIGVKKYGKKGMTKKAHAATDTEEDDGIESEHIGFDKLTKKLSKKPGIYDPAGLAYHIGEEKYGKKGMARKAARGRK